MDLRYCCITAHYDGETRHPQAVLDEIGIKYKDAIPQSIADQWWFRDCYNIPAVLPKYVSTM